MRPRYICNERARPVFILGYYISQRSKAHVRFCFIACFFFSSALIGMVSPLTTRTSPGSHHPLPARNSCLIFHRDVVVLDRGALAFPGKFNSKPQHRFQQNQKLTLYTVRQKIYDEFRQTLHDSLIYRIKVIFRLFIPISGNAPIVGLFGPISIVI